MVAGGPVVALWDVPEARLARVQEHVPVHSISYRKIRGTDLAVSSRASQSVIFAHDLDTMNGSKHRAEGSKVPCTYIAKEAFASVYLPMLDWFSRNVYPMPYPWIVFKKQCFRM
jgi:hypothetical protein